MATRTIANAGGNWSATGTWVEGAVPTSADDVVATATSGNVTIDATAACQSLILTNYVGTLTHTSAITLSIGSASGGALTFVAGMTYVKNTGILSFVATTDNATAGWPITTAGKSVYQMAFSGTGGKWTLQDTLTYSGFLIVNNGYFKTNNQAIAGGSAGFLSNTANTRTLDLGSSAITCGSIGTQAGTGLTITANTAVVSIAGNQIGDSTGTTVDWGGLSVKNNSSSQATLYGTNFLNITADSTVLQIANGFAFGNNMTITGTLTIRGNDSGRRYLARSTIRGTNRTITAAITSFAWCDFEDITGAGAGSWNVSAITGGAGDAGGNSGLTFAAPVTRFAVTAGNWSSTTTWSATSGGASGASIPLAQDSAVFNSSTPAGTYTIDMNRPCKDLTCSAGTRTIASSGSYSPAITGSLDLSGTTTFTSSWPSFSFIGRGTHTVTMNGQSFGCSTKFDSPGGTYTLQDAFTNTSSLQHLSGTLNTNNQTVTATLFSDLASAVTRVLTLGTSTINLTFASSSQTIWNLAGSNVTLNASTSTIVYPTAAAGINLTFFGGGKVYGTLKFDGSTAAGVSGGALLLSSSGGNNTFNTLRVANGLKGLTFGQGTTTTVTNWDVNGVDASNLVTLTSSASGTFATLTKTDSIPVSSAFLSVKDSHAGPASTFYASPGGVNVSGNAGWTFGPIPSALAPPLRLLAVAASRASVI